MCLPNVNITATLYKNVYDDNGVKHRVAPFDTIVAKTHTEGLVISDFYIVLSFNILGTNNPDKVKDNLIMNKQTMDVKLRMTKLSKEIENQQFSDLMEFNVDFSDENLVSNYACVPYCQFDKTIRVKRIIMPSKNPYGSYILKILTRVSDNQDKKWNIQAIIPLRVE